MPLTAALRFELAHPEQAESIVECFADAYSGTYPLEDFIRPEALRARIGAGRTIFAVALEVDDVVAAVALEPLRNGAPTGDFGHGVSRRSHRGRGLFAALHRPLIERARDLGLTTVHSQCVTSHVQSQRPMLQLGGRVAGLTLAAAPRELRFPGLREELLQRESFLNWCFALTPRDPAVVHVPSSLRGAVTEVYDSLGLPFDHAKPPQSRASLHFAVERSSELGTATLTFGEDGSAATKLEQEIGKLEAEECLYATLPLQSGATPLVVDVLRELGFSFAAVLPGRQQGDGDALLLQRPRDPVSSNEIEVASEAGRRIKQLVFEDLCTVRGAVAV